MKISKLFHWLYAILMFLPFMAVPFDLLRVTLSGSFELLYFSDVIQLIQFPALFGVSENIMYVYTYLFENLFGMYGPTTNVIVGALTYWTIVSIGYLIFDVFMYVPLLVHRWIDKARLE